LNLIGTSDWTDLISGELVADISGEFEMKPYQSAWLSN
jgi:sucrose phosphorylase